MAQSELSFFSEPQQLGTRVVKKAFVKKKERGSTRSFFATSREASCADRDGADAACG